VDGERVALAADAPTHARVVRPFDVIAGEIRLARFDPNPLALAETHPDKNGNAVSLGDATLAEWLTGLRDAFAIVERHLPGIAAEMHAMLGLVVPVGTDRVRHLSASYREYVGALYLTLHPDPMTMAEALVHEFQHNKLNLVSWHYKVLENGYDALYRSPVRPDARPLMGILLAAHAFVPVAELYVQALEGGAVLDGRHASARLEDVVSRNDEALRVLSAHAVPDAAGARVLARLASIHARHLALGHALARDVSHVA
jgi:HEXXH motif-containing protein